MSTVFIVAFGLTVLYAVLGNVVVYWILVRRRVAVRFFWSGTPGYLYRVCAQANPPVGIHLRRFAYSTNVAFLVAVALGIFLAGLTH